MEESGRYVDSSPDALTPPETDWIGDDIDDEAEITKDYQVGKP